MMKNLKDLAVAERELRNPKATADDLVLIANYHPELRGLAAAHPNADPTMQEGLLRGGGFLLAKSFSPPTSGVDLASADDTPTVWPVPPTVSSSNNQGLEPIGNADDIDFRRPKKRSRAKLVALIVAIVLALTGGAVAARAIFSTGNPGGPVVVEPIDPPVQPAPGFLDGSLGLDWVNVNGGSQVDRLNGVAVAPNGNIAVVGHSLSDDGNVQHKGDWPLGAGHYGIYTPDGTFIIGSYNPEKTFNDVIMTTNGEFWFLGSHDGSASLEVYDPWGNGGRAWALVDWYGQSTFTAGSPAPDGGVIALGVSESAFLAPDQQFVVRLGPDWGLVWETELPATIPSGSLKSIVATDDGGAVAVGSMPGAGSDALVVRFGANGQIKWIKTFGGSGDESFNAVALTPEGNIIAVGETGSTDGDFPVTSGHRSLIVSLTPNGDIAWQATYNPGISRFTAVTITDDGQIVVGGTQEVIGDDGQPTRQANVGRIGPNGSGPIEPFGEIGGGGLSGIAWGPNQNIIVVGTTSALNGPLRAWHGDFDMVMANLTFDLSD
jgi:hypothetical protein